MKYVFFGNLDGMRVTATVTDFNEFLLAGPDSEVFVCDEDCNQFTCRKKDVEWHSACSYENLH